MLKLLFVQTVSFLIIHWGKTGRDGLLYEYERMCVGFRISGLLAVMTRVLFVQRQRNSADCLKVVVTRV